MIEKFLATSDITVYKDMLEGKILGQKGRGKLRDTKIEDVM